MKKSFLSIGFLFVVLISQGQISKGKDFWFGFLANYYQQTGEMRVYITSEAPCSGMISSPLQGWSQTFTVTPGVSTLVVVPYNIGENFNSDIISNQALHVVTTECVSVFAHYYQQFTSDAAVIFPTNSVGRDYVVTSWYDANMNNGSPEFLIAATEDATTIDITPSTTAGSHTAGVTYSISIDSGEVYQLQSGNGDLTGTIVRGTNNKNFALFGGHVCANIIGCGYCDHLFDQLYPTPSWGTEFVTVPYFARDYDVFRVLASQNGTQFSINGGAPINLNAGQFNQFNLSAVSYISSNLPVSVMQYSTGTACDANGDPLGDPFMIALSPITQNINKVTYNAFANASPSFTYYTNIVAKTADLATVMFDGVSIGGAFTPVPQNPAYSYERRTITQGDHTITANQGIIAYVYGYGEYESYGYSAGVRVQVPFLSVYDTTRAYCPLDTVYLNLNTPDTARLIYTEWDLGDGSPHLFDTLHFWHVYQNYGSYPITLIYELKSACKKDTMVIDTVKILGPEPDFGGPYQYCVPQNVSLSVRAKVTPDTLFFKMGPNSWFTTDTNYVLNFYADKDTVVYVRVSSNICDGFDTAYIYVASDTAGFTFSNACAGTPVDFSNASHYAVGLTYSWLWDFGDGATSVGVFPSHQYTTGGTYNVKLRLTSPAPAFCTDSIIHAVTIYDKPNASLIANYVCNDSLLSPINNSTVANGALSYDWDFGDGTLHTTAQSPSHIYAQSGAYNVTLIASVAGGACSDTATIYDNIIIGAVQEFSGVNLCLGSVNQFNDLTVNTSGSAILSYNWDFGDASSSNQQSPSHTYATNGNYLVALVLDYGSNCFDSIKHTISVNPIPVAGFTIADLCNSGLAVPVNTTAINSGNVNYTWSFGDNSAAANGLNPSHTYALSGNYNIQLIALSDSLCADTVSNLIQVIRGTTIDFVAPAVCEGVTTNFTDQTSNPYNTTINAYGWSFGDGNFANQQNTAHIYSSFGTYNVQLRLDYGNNCADSITKQVTVYEIPVAAFSVADVCNDSVVTPQNASSISNGTLAYGWTFGDGSTVINGLNPSHSYQQSGIYSIQVLATSNAGCADSISHPVNVIVGTTIDFSAPAVCEGVTTNFTDQTSNPYATTINGYAWSFGDGNLANQQNTTHVYGSFGVYNVELRLDYGNNCADSITKQVTVNEIPVAAFSVADVCNDSVVSPQNTSSISNGTLAYGWTFGDGSTVGNGLNHSHTYQQSGIYSIQVLASSNAGCADSVTHPVIVTIGTTIDFTTLPLCEGGLSVFTNTTSNPYNTTINSYNWSFGDGSISGQQSATHTYSAYGTYTVKLELEYGNNCRDSIAKPITIHQKPVADFSSTTPCIGGSMQLSDLSSPGSEINAWNWDLGDGASATSQNGLHVYATSGNHSAQLIVTTSNGCKDTILKTVTVLGVSNAQFNVPAICYPGASLFTNTTDLITYPVSTFAWTFGDGSANNSQAAPSHNYPAAGIYSVTLAANFVNGCADTSSQPVEVYVVPTVSAVITDVSCFGGSDGSIQLSPVLGQQPFAYSWSNALNSATISSLLIGNYTVTFTDAHTCSSTGSYSIAQPTQLLLDTTVTQVTCFGYSDGYIQVIAAQGTPAYNFAWSNGSQTSLASQLNAGIYSVTVTDAKGCSVSSSVTLMDPLPYTLLLDSLATMDLGTSIQLTADAVNGNPVSWSWSPDEFLSCAACRSTEANPVNDMVYTVVSVDDKGCMAKAETRLYVVPVYNVFVPNIFTPNGDGVNDFFEVFGNKEAWKQFEVNVFDRWGEKVFEANDMNFKWDGMFKGRLLNPQVLIYTVKVIYLNNFSDKLFKGSLTLVR